MSKEHKKKQKQAIALFKQGNLNEAKDLLSSLVNTSDTPVHLLLLYGHILLLENRLKDAESFLLKALKTISESRGIQSILLNIIYKRAIESIITFIYYRLNDISKAAIYSGSLNITISPAEMKYWNEHIPYTMSSSVKKTEIDFEIKDPLPLIKVSVNESIPSYFFIDTGGSELIIDTDYARSLKLKELSSYKSFFGGGKTACVTRSYADTLKLGDFIINHVPITILDTKRFSKMLYNNKYQVDGILGTSIFYQFLMTLDYSNNKICFEIIDASSLTSLDTWSKTNNVSRIPFWMAADHFMLAKGSIDNAHEMLFFIDTGLAGMSFTCPKSTVYKAKLPLRQKERISGLGGGGKIKSIPFKINSLTLGNVVGYKLNGVYGPFPPQLERSFGFRIGGLISHEFFRERTVVFDFTNMQLHIKG